MKLEFSQQKIEKKIQLSYIMKIRPVRSELFHVGQTDRHEDANSRFSQFCERAPKRTEV
jgi:hypothetical protein